MIDSVNWIKCDVDHQILAFKGRTCPLCIALDGLDGAYEALDAIGKLLKKGPVTKKKKEKRAKLKGKVLVMPKRK